MTAGLSGSCERLAIQTDPGQHSPARANKSIMATVEEATLPLDYKIDVLRKVCVG